MSTYDDIVREIVERAIKNLEEELGFQSYDTGTYLSIYETACCDLLIWLATYADGDSIKKSDVKSAIKLMDKMICDYSKTRGEGQHYDSV